MLDLGIRLLARGLVPMFVVGMAGASIVVAITFVHDLIDFFAADDTATTPSTALQRN